LTGAIRYNGGNLQFCAGVMPWETLGTAGSGLTALTGDVTASGTGSVAATVASVGGVTAANVASGANAANAATDANTASTIVKRDASSGFSAGAVSATSVTATGAVTQGSAVFKGSSSGTVTVQAPATVSPSYTLTLPTSAGGSDQVLKTDVSGQLSWTSLPTALPPNGAAGGDLSGTYPDPTVATVGGSTAANINSAELRANAATAANTSNAIVKRDGSGGFSAGSVTTTATQADMLTLNNAGSLLNIVSPLGGAWTMTLPATAGVNGQVMQTNGLGSMTWVTPLSSSTGFVQGGNSFGAKADLGTNDVFDLNVRTNGTTRMTVTSGGNVGIGTSSPSYTLDVNGAINATALKIGGVDVTTGGGGNFKADGTVAMTGAFQAADGTQAAPSITFASDTNLGLYKSNSDEISIVNGNAKNWIIKTTGFDSNWTYGPLLARTAGNAALPSYTFNTNTNTGMFNPLANNVGFSTNGSERLRIDSSGNVGIGTTSMGSKLTVAGVIESKTGGIRFPDGTVQTTATGGGSGGTLIPNWPDVIRCTTSGRGEVMLNLTTGPFTDGKYYYSEAGSGWDDGSLISYNADGTYNWKGSSIGTLSNCNVSIATLYSQGRAYNLVGGGSNLWTASGSNTYFAGGNVGIGTTSPSAMLDVAGALKASSGTYSSYVIGSKFMKNDGTAWYGFGSSSSTLALVTGGNERLTVDTSGNVGIGTTAPGASLEIVNMASGDAPLRISRQSNSLKKSAVSLYPAGALSTSNPAWTFGLEKGLTGFSIAPFDGTTSLDTFYLDRLGNLGVGTMAPYFKLDVQQSDSDTHLNIQNNASSSAHFPGVLVQNYGGTSGGSPSFTGIQFRGNSGAPQPVQSGDSLFMLSGLGASDTSYGSQTGGLIQMQAAETFSSTAAGTNISISTAPTGSTTLQTRLMILNGGNVGIGTTNPGTKLQVAGEISPSADGLYSLGDSGLRFSAVYATNGTVQTSDEREKKEIENSDLGLDFVNALRPVSYRWKKGPDTYLHYGLIAQETESAIAAAKARRAPANDIDNVIVAHDKVTDAYGLRYTELVSPLIKAIQELYARFQGHEGRLATIERRELEKDAKILRLEEENAALKARLDRIEEALQKTK
jgi:hypothetical protein